MRLVLITAITIGNTLGIHLGKLLLGDASMELGHFDQLRGHNDF